MPAYVRQQVFKFLSKSCDEIVGKLQQSYANDGFSSQYTRQTQAWSEIVPRLQTVLRSIESSRPEARIWTVLLEYPLYRLRRRIDLVLLVGPLIVVVECKVGATAFTAEDRRQVEEYALDLRDFHAASQGRKIIPVLWCTEAEASDTASNTCSADSHVSSVVCVGTQGLQGMLSSITFAETEAAIPSIEWDSSPYRPVPGVIEAATHIFAGHDVRSISNADADNLQSAAKRLVELIQEARNEGRRYLLMLTGVPGSGKTLAGLHVVHSAVATGVEESGDIVYLSGNTPLVAVLREALSRDELRRSKVRGERRKLETIRREVRARIQHINDFLQQSLLGDSVSPPHEHVIVFDEAQRAWDERQGLEKFNRSASEPSLLLDLMARHVDWCVCVCLVGGGQEINSGEDGVQGWGDALRKLEPSQREKWNVFAPPDVLDGGLTAGVFALGQLPDDLSTHAELDLQLRVPHRSFRSPRVSEWVDHVLAGNESSARATASNLGEYPIVITRSIDIAKRWIRKQGRGERRFGLTASSGARRLRADGFGLMLHASAGNEIAHWYLNPRGDIRSSFALEVPANEYTCQGLELDFVCLCWGGDLLWDDRTLRWRHNRLSGTKWQKVQEANAQLYLQNSYRVLLTRAREGLAIWVPEGEDEDTTRKRLPLDNTAEFLLRCGATPIADS
jgi:hypothetical protein